MTAPVYVYGIVRAGALDGLSVEGVADRPVATIEGDGVAAVASELTQEPFRVRRRDLHRHLDVLEAAFAQTALVPCAFGMVLQSREAVVEELLGPRRAELLGLIERLDGRAQLNVTAVYDEDTVLREVVQSEPEIARLREQSRALGEAGHFAGIRLGELVAAALEERRAVDSPRLLGRLGAKADDVLVEEAALPVVLKASFLVSRADGFEATLEELAAEEAPRLSFESIGPLPPTAFATLEAAG